MNKKSLAIVHGNPFLQIAEILFLTSMMFGLLLGDAIRQILLSIAVGLLLLGRMRKYKKLCFVNTVFLKRLLLSLVPVVVLALLFIRFIPRNPESVYSKDLIMGACISLTLFFFFWEYVLGKRDFAGCFQGHSLVVLLRCLLLLFFIAMVIVPLFFGLGSFFMRLRHSILVIQIAVWVYAVVLFAEHRSYQTMAQYSGVIALSVYAIYFLAHRLHLGLGVVDFNNWLVPGGKAALAGLFLSFLLPWLLFTVIKEEQKVLIIFFLLVYMVTVLVLFLTLSTIFWGVIIIQLFSSFLICCCWEKKSVKIIILLAIVAVVEFNSLHLILRRYYPSQNISMNMQIAQLVDARNPNMYSMKIPEELCIISVMQTDEATYKAIGKQSPFRALDRFTSLRMSIWGNVVRLMECRPLTGYGWVKYTTLLDFGVITGVHSLYLETAFIAGYLVLIVLILLGVCGLYFSIWMQYKSQEVLLVPFITMQTLLTLGFCGFLESLLVPSRPLMIYLWTTIVWLMLPIPQLSNHYNDVEECDAS